MKADFIKGQLKSVELLVIMAISKFYIKTATSEAEINFTWSYSYQNM